MDLKKIAMAQWDKIQIRKAASSQMNEITVFWRLNPDLKMGLGRAKN